MAERTEFVYHSIKLYKSESLGSGSYGGVCKAKCDGLLCAAKIMHPTLFDLRDPGTDSYLHKFQEECNLLSLARHPNVVQYLATYYDPDTRLPVLLMELCDESLTKFLEHSPETLPYYLQLNICHDIALALVYLHSNGVIHRDLTGNNVLMIAGPRAKITDFGMSKLATVNPRMTALTPCPGNILYMSPEALDCAESYTDKLDIFSFGVIVIQILTRKFPKPADRFRMVHVPQFEEEVRVVVPEMERREAHLKLIPDTHALKPLALQCLKNKEWQRPSALDLMISERLSDLKQSSQYTQSLHQAKGTLEIQQLQQLLQGLRIMTEAKTREASDYHAQIVDLHKRVEAKQHTIEMTARHLQEYQRTIVDNERQLQEYQQGKELVEELQKEQEHRGPLEPVYLQQRDMNQQAQERKIQQLEKQGASSILPQQQPVPTTCIYKPMIAVKRDLDKMTWKRKMCAPENMHRGAAVVHGNTAYFRPSDSPKIYLYQNTMGEEQWCQLPDNANINCGLAVLDGLLTSVGGSRTNRLLSLTGETKMKQWSVVFSPMPTPRESTACVTTEQVLVVAGGYSAGYLDTVEVMKISTKQWTTVPSLPQKRSRLSAILCEDTLYLAGGYKGFEPSKSVFTCSLSHLISTSNTLGSRMRRTLSRSPNIWREISSLPVEDSTLATIGGHVLAIGGDDDTGDNTTDVFRYNSHTDSWNVISNMNTSRSLSFAVTLPEDCLVVVGGFNNSVEILE